VSTRTGASSAVPAAVPTDDARSDHRGGAGELVLRGGERRDGRLRRPRDLADGADAEDQEQHRQQVRAEEENDPQAEAGLAVVSERQGDALWQRVGDGAAVHPEQGRGDQLLDLRLATDLRRRQKGREKAKSVVLAAVEDVVGPQIGLVEEPPQAPPRRAAGAQGRLSVAAVESGRRLKAR